MRQLEPRLAEGVQGPIHPSISKRVRRETPVCKWESRTRKASGEAGGAPVSLSPLEKAEARKRQEGQVSYCPRSFTHEKWPTSPVTQ